MAQAGKYATQTKASAQEEGSGTAADSPTRIPKLAVELAVYWLLPEEKANASAGAVPVG